MRELSRGQFLRRGAVTVGGMAAFGLADAASALGRTAGSPTPIQGGLAVAGTNLIPSPGGPGDPTVVAHVLPPGVGFDVSTITDFKGVVGASDIEGTAHGSDAKSYGFDTDMRFMTGTYIDTDGRLRSGTFGFI
jgi:hypothetical protein